MIRYNMIRNDMIFKFKFKLFIGITSKATSFTNEQQKNMKNKIGVHKGLWNNTLSHIHTLTHTPHMHTYYLLQLFTTFPIYTSSHILLDSKHNIMSYI